VVTRLTSQLRRANREADALYVEAGRAALALAGAEAAARLHAMLDRLPVCQHGWAIPIEPSYRPVRDSPEFRNVAVRLAERAK
jgi:hypothetical protein